MSIELYRIDDRLVHGQVVVGWGQPLGARFIVLVDDAVRESDWEQALYRMGVPDSIEIIFVSVDEAVVAIAEWISDSRKGIVLVGSVQDMTRLIEGGAEISNVNIGGVHHRPGRTQRLPYVYLTQDEATALERLASDGVRVTAQDLPTARPVPLRELM